MTTTTFKKGIAFSNPAQEWIGDFAATKKRIVSIFGLPNELCQDDGEATWYLRLSTGTLFSIYNFKNPFNRNRPWNIGATPGEAVEVFAFLRSLGFNPKA